MTEPTAQAGMAATHNHNVFTRSDTLLGVCEAIGSDFGFNPLWLRLAVIPAIFFWPAETIIGYLALGLVVLASRLLFPVPRQTVTAPGEAMSLAPATSAALDVAAQDDMAFPDTELLAA